MHLCNILYLIIICKYIFSYTFNNVHTHISLSCARTRATNYARVCTL